jgi:hypothetical protein
VIVVPAARGSAARIGSNLSVMDALLLGLKTRTRREYLGPGREFLTTMVREYRV